MGGGACGASVPSKKASSQKKAAFELAIPKQNLDTFGRAVMHFVEEGYESLEEIHRATVRWFRKNNLRTPAHPGEVIQRILRKADGRG